MSPTERKTLINRNCTDLSPTKQRQLLKVSRSSLYYTPVGVNAATLKLMCLTSAPPVIDQKAMV